MQVTASLPQGTVAFMEGDVTKEEHWNNAVKVVVQNFGGLHVVVNNAGVVHRSAPSSDVPLSELERIMNVNVSPLYHSANAVRPHFAKQKFEVFVNVSSISAPRPRLNLVWYAGSKGAVSTITRGLAAEFANDGIRCNAVLPVVAETGMLSEVLGGTDSFEGRGRLLAAIPLGRVCEARDIGNAACFLASEESSFITGVELPVDGGRALI